MAHWPKDYSQSTCVDVQALIEMVSSLIREEVHAGRIDNDLRVALGEVNGKLCDAQAIAHRECVSIWAADHV